MGKKTITMEDVNTNIYLTMANSLRFPLNELVAWAIFGDSTFTKESALIYSNYADNLLDTELINESHLELMNNIELDVKQCINENANKVDFSTIDSAYDGINGILNRFLPDKYEELTSLIFQKDSIFKGYPIWWSAIVIAYREMAIFAFKNGSYYLSMQLNEFSTCCQSQMLFKNVDFIQAHKKKLSSRNKIGGNTRWGNSVKDQRLRYLEIDKHYSKEVDRKTSIKETAELIYFKHNEFNVGFETIRDHLSAARKGIFTNNGK